MATFAASKYDPDNDPHMPKIGADSPDGDGKITKVQMIEAVRLLTDPEPEMGDNRELFVVDHPSRPFVKYLVWVK